MKQCVYAVFQPVANLSMYSWIRDCDAKVRVGARTAVFSHFPRIACTKSGALRQARKPTGGHGPKHGVTKNGRDATTTNREPDGQHDKLCTRFRWTTGLPACCAEVTEAVAKAITKAVATTFATTFTTAFATAVATAVSTAVSAAISAALSAAVSKAISQAILPLSSTPFATSQKPPGPCLSECK